MWGALIRVGARYAWFRRWKNTLALCGTVLLCVITAFLIDAEKYLSATIVGTITAAALIGLGMHYLQERHEIRQRERQKLEQVARRAAAAEARGEKIQKVKASAAQMAKGVSSGAAGFVDVAKTGLSGARNKLGNWRGKRTDQQ